MSHPISSDVPLPVDGVKVVVLANTRDVVVRIVVMWVWLLVHHIAGRRQLRDGSGVSYVQQVIIAGVAGVGVTAQQRERSKN